MTGEVVAASLSQAPFEDSGQIAQGREVLAVAEGMLPGHQESSPAHQEPGTLDCTWGGGSDNFQAIAQGGRTEAEFIRVSEWRQSREGGGGEGGQAARGLQPRTRARARTRAVTDSLQWLALTRNLKARKRGRAGEGGESGAQRRAGRRAGARAEPAAGAGLPRAPHIREPAHPLGGGRAALCRALVGERGARRPPLRARRGERGGGGADVSDVAWWSPSCHVAGGGRGGGLKRGRLSRERETRKYEGSL